MRRKDWEIIALGDCIVRETYGWRLQESDRVGGPAFVGVAELTSADAFQVVQIASGIVTLVRLLSQTSHPGSKTTTTEVIELQEFGATLDAQALCDADCPAIYGWRWDPPARGEARLTGGFIVTRADGSVEHDRCPTATTKLD